MHMRMRVFGPVSVGVVVVVLEVLVLVAGMRVRVRAFAVAVVVGVCFVVTVLRVCHCRLPATCDLGDVCCEPHPIVLFRSAAGTSRSGGMGGILSSLHPRAAPGV